VEKHGRAGQATDDIIRRMRFACWINKATNTHSEYVIFPAFPRQQWLRECALVLGLYVHGLYGLSSLRSLVTHYRRLWERGTISH